MEENVALDSAKQKDFSKSIKGIKKLIKKKGGKEALEKKLKDGKVQKRKRPERGLVYLGHIPHGFYENEMTQYFKQFGVVTNVRVIKSKRTGKSKGYAFVEFREPSVAQIVADTMNNYLMGKRLLKASYIPPEKQRRAIRKLWNPQNCPGANARLALKKAYNKDNDEAGDLAKARKLLSNFRRMKKKLSVMGLSYDFFKPVDIPAALINDVEVKKGKSPVKDETDIKSKKRNRTDSVKVEDKKEVKVEVKTKKAKKVKKPVETDANTETLQKKVSIKNKTNKQSKIKSETSVDNNLKKINTNKNDKTTTIAETKESIMQKKKQNNLKKAGLNPPENFIKLKQETEDDSDSSLDFDSDEFEKMIGGGDSADSDDATDDEDFVESDNESEEEDNKVVKKSKPNQKKQFKQQKAIAPRNKGKKQKFENNKKGTDLIKKKQFKQKK